MDDKNGREVRQLSDGFARDEEEAAKEDDGRGSEYKECMDTNDTACYNLILDIVKEQMGHRTMTPDEEYIFLKKQMREAMRGKTEEQKNAILAKKLSEIEGRKQRGTETSTK